MHEGFEIGGHLRYLRNCPLVLEVVLQEVWRRSYNRLALEIGNKSIIVDTHADVCQNQRQQLVYACSKGEWGHTPIIICLHVQ